MNVPSMTTGSGQMIATAPPPLHKDPIQKLAGSAVDMGVAKTGAALATQVKAGQQMGIGMKGGRRKRRTKKTKKGKKKQTRRKRRTYKGGSNMALAEIPEGGTMPGVSHAKNHLAAGNNLNQIRAGAVYDKMIGVTPYTV